MYNFDKQREESPNFKMSQQYFIKLGEKNGKEMEICSQTSCQSEVCVLSVCFSYKSFFSYSSCSDLNLSQLAFALVPTDSAYQVLFYKYTFFCISKHLRYCRELFLTLKTSPSQLCWEVLLYREKDIGLRWPNLTLPSSHLL